MDPTSSSTRNTTRTAATTTSNSSLSMLSLEKDGIAVSSSSVSSSSNSVPPVESSPPPTIVAETTTTTTTSSTNGNQAPTTTTTTKPEVCQVCKFTSCDVRFTECGCRLHARCTPLSLLVQSSSMLLTQQPQPSADNDGSNGESGSATITSLQCPFCFKPSLGMIELLPLTSDLLDQAVDIRRQATAASTSSATSTRHRSASITSNSDPNKTSPKQNGNNSTDPMMNGSNSINHNNKRKRLSSFGATMAEASYLLLSSSYSPLEDLSSGGNSLFTDGDFQRTGRWTENEKEFVDFLLHAFDRGQLPIPNGVRLNDFLCQILLSKSSRLTKKLKNAKLSARTYQLTFAPSNNPTQRNTLDYVKLSTLQEKFLVSVYNEASQLELRFHLSKTWRIQFSNLCAQLSCKILDATAWLQSLEEMEKRATEAEETIRKARRKRMGLALKADVQNVSSNGVFFAGVPVARAPAVSSESTKNPVKDNSSVKPSAATKLSVDTESVFSSQSGDLCSSGEPDVHINTMLELAVPSISKKRPAQHSSSASLGELADIFDDLMETSSHNASYYARSSHGNNCGTFLDCIIEFVEANNLPFEHVDVWVPSLSPIQSTSTTDAPTRNPAEPTIRLCHAGHATRSDLDPALLCQLYEYGEYSMKFSFAVGCGLPGRVFTTFQTKWDCRIDEANPKYFERTGGAKVYGVKTALGIPLLSTTTGCIVVGFYSVYDRPPDDAVITAINNELLRLQPEPRWKLVVDVTGVNTDNNTTTTKYNNVMSTAQSSPPTTGLTDPGFSRFSVNLSSSSNDWQLQQQSNQLGSQPATLSPASSRSSFIQQPTKGPRDEEVEIARVLGECMPLTNSAISSAGVGLDLDQFVSLRLLLLRPPERRTTEENTVVEIIRKSYEGYQLGGPRWSSAELASLVVKDWSYLRASMLPPAPTVAVQAPNNNNNIITNHNFPTLAQPKTNTASTTSASHQCHVLDIPQMSTFTNTGGPTRMPFFPGGSTTGSNNMPALSRPRGTSFNGFLPMGAMNQQPLQQQQLQQPQQQQQRFMSSANYSVPKNTT